MARRRRREEPYELEWITPLYWEDASSHVMHKIYQEARASIRFYGGGAYADPALGRQSYLRRVSVEFYRRLEIYGIYVEGAGQGW
jgi:hypothetical protein